MANDGGEIRKPCALELRMIAKMFHVKRGLLKDGYFSTKLPCFTTVLRNLLSVFIFVPRETFSRRYTAKMGKYRNNTSKSRLKFSQNMASFQWVNAPPTKF